MNMTILLALMIASATVYVLKTTVKLLLLREAGRAELSKGRQRAPAATR